MYTNEIALQNLAVTIATISVVLCPTLCGIMAYRISRVYTTLRSAD